MGGRLAKKTIVLIVNQIGDEMNDKYVEQHLKMKYFVLKPEGNSIYAKASRNAMKTYANIIEDEAPQFAAELLEWAGKEALEVLKDNGLTND